MISAKAMMPRTSGSTLRPVDEDPADVERRPPRRRARRTRTMKAMAADLRRVMEQLQARGRVARATVLQARSGRNRQAPDRPRRPLRPACQLGYRLGRLPYAASSSQLLAELRDLDVPGEAERLERADAESSSCRTRTRPGRGGPRPGARGGCCASPRRSVSSATHQLFVESSRVSKRREPHRCVAEFTSQVACRPNVVRKNMPHST